MLTSAFKAAVARQIITPPHGIYQIGYGDRTRGNRGMHDDLTATALLFDDGNKRLALVACDLLCLNEFIVDRIRSAVGFGTDVLVCCSHTHSGPIGYADEKSNRLSRGYIDSLVQRVAQAVQQAQSQLQPAQLTWSQSSAAIAVNRRERQADGHIEIGINPDGPVDRGVNVLSVLSASGARLATLVNFACHGTVLGPDNLLISADWIGAMRRRVENELGGMALFLQGATGDLNPEMGWKTPGVWELMQRQGEQVADAAISACQQNAEPLKGAPVGLVRQEIWLPFEAEANTPTPPTDYRKKILVMDNLPAWMSFLTDSLLRQRYPWRSRIEARAGHWATPLRVNTARIGDLGLVTFGSETFTELGMAARAASPARHTLFASITDGCIGYLAPAESHAQGGYEIEVTPYAYRFPGKLEAGCADLALQAARQGLKALFPD